MAKYKQIEFPLNALEFCWAIEEAQEGILAVVRYRMDAERILEKLRAEYGDGNFEVVMIDKNLKQQLSKKEKVELKKGDMVCIYQDPLTCNDLEGTAKLLNRYEDSYLEKHYAQWKPGKIQEWRVYFNSGDIVKRLINLDRCSV